MSELAHCDLDEYNQLVEYLANELNRLKSKYGPTADVNTESQTQFETFQDPPVVRSKGCGPSTATTGGRRQQTHFCGTCGATGHNRCSCPTMRQSGNMDVGTDDLGDDSHHTHLVRE